jgi:membrane protein
MTASGAVRRWAGELARAVESSLVTRCLKRFAAVGGTDRALLLGGKAFITVIPLLIVAAATFARHGGDSKLADRLTARFHVTGQSAEAIRTLFRQPPGATGTITLAGLLLLLSVLSLTRTLQRTYEAALELPAIGLRGTLSGLTGTGVLLASILVLSLIAGVLPRFPAGGILAQLLKVVAATAIWLVLQSLLLSRRIPVRRLLPGAVVAGVGQVLVTLYSTLWMPRLIGHDAQRYGVIGIAFAMLTWLIIVSFLVVAAAVLSAELGGADVGSAPRPPHRGRGRSTVVKT